MKAFIGILELHGIKLSQNDQQQIVDQWGKEGGYVKYKEVLHYISVNLDLLDPFESNWILRKTNSKSLNTQGIQSDAKSYVSGASSIITDVSIDQELRERARNIAKDQFKTKLTEMETIKEELDIKGSRNIQHGETEFNLGEDFQSFNAKVQQDYNLLQKSKKQRQVVTNKPDQRISTLQVKREEQTNESILNALQPKEAPKKEGKKNGINPDKYLFNDFLNHETFDERDRLEKRYQLDYSNPTENMNTIDLQGSQSGIEIQSTSQAFINSHKTKVNPDFIKRIIDISNITQNQRDIIKQLYEENVDFRSLNHFKNKLLEGAPNDATICVSIELYDTLIKQMFGDKLQKSQDLLRNELLLDKNQISLTKLSEIVDLFNFLPIKVIKEKNKSSDIYMVMTSNKRNSHSVKTQELDILLQSVLEIVWSKIQERFQTVAAGFRFFDSNNKLKISPSEFVAGLELLRVKVNTDDSQKIFKYLDKDQDGYISYNEFCELCEEKRRKIDPFEAEMPKINGSKTSVSFNPESIYMSNLKMDDLEAMTKLQSYSSQKKKLNIIKKQLPKSVQILEDKPFGKVSFGDGSGLDQMGDVINHQYLKNYLEDQVTRNAAQQVMIQNYKARSQHNRASTLRTQSVKKQIQTSDFELMIENQRKGKAEKNNLSFSQIVKNERKIQREALFPPIHNRDLSLQGTIRKSNLDLTYDESIGNALSPIKGVDVQGKLNYYNNKVQILEEVHKMRLAMVEKKEDLSTAKVQASAMTKREKEDILSSYFQAKKQLGAK